MVHISGVGCMWFTEEPSNFSMSQRAQNLTCSLMKKPHAWLEDCLNMLLSCFRKRRSGAVHSPVRVRPLPDVSCQVRTRKKKGELFSRFFDAAIDFALDFPLFARKQIHSWEQLLTAITICFCRKFWISEKYLARRDLVTYYRDVQLDFTSEIKVLYMLFERCHSRNRNISIKQCIKYFNIRSKIQLNHPVVCLSISKSELSRDATQLMRWGKWPEAIT